MKLVELKCKNCGAVLKVQPDTADIHCEHCKANYKLDDEAQHIKYDDMEKAGYDYEKGKLKARQEHELEKQRQKVEAQQAAAKAEKDAKMKKWIILAWIFLFPIMFTYWLWTKSTLDKRIKIILTVGVWLFFIIVGASSHSSSPSTNTNSQTDNETATVDVFEAFVNRYNELGDDKITDLFDYDVKDKTAGYYQTEFRLQSYDDAKAKLGKISSGRILLVDEGGTLTNTFRVYAFVSTREDANKVTRSLVKTIEPTVLNKDIDEMLATDDIVNGALLYGDIDGVVIHTDNKVLVKSSKTLFATIPDANEKNIAMRKCTVMEASDIYTTGVGKKTDNIFYDAKNTCEAFYEGGTPESFYEAIDIDWENRSEEKIDDRSLTYYVDKLGW